MATTPVLSQHPGVDGILLLGWMDRDNAVKYLTTNCVFDPPLSEAAAETLWKQYRERCESLPERKAAAPAFIPLNHEERQHATKFMTFLNSLGPHQIKDVVKVDLSALVVHQLVITVSHSDTYLREVNSCKGWLHKALPLTPRPPAQIQTRVAVNGLNTMADIDIPHAEFAFLPDPTGQFFSVQQFQCYISVFKGMGTMSERLILKAGYHRSFARARSMMPPATVPSAVVALEQNTLGSPPNNLAGAGLTVATAGLRPDGCRPAIFSDFFNDALAIKIKLRKKRYQLQVRSTWVEIDM